MNEELKLKNRLEEARTEKTLSQEQLAVLAGVSLQTISSIEAGEYCPSAKLAQILSIKLEKKFEDLFYFEEAKITSGNVTAKDERAVFFENISYKYGYNFIVLALVIITLYEILIFNKVTWLNYGVICLSILAVSFFKLKYKIYNKSIKNFITEVAIFCLLTLSIAIISYLIESAL